MSQAGANQDSGWGTGGQCVFDRIAEKWTLRILAKLAMTPMTFLALQRALAPVSRKMLTETLRHLERDGLVARRPELHSPAVEYSLTGLGQSLCGPLESLRRWSEDNVEAVEAARRSYDYSHRSAENRLSFSRPSDSLAAKSATVKAPVGSQLQKTRSRAHAK
jgi:DNA-binding HxlR family transcriptional regulator